MSTEYDAIYQAVYDAMPTKQEILEAVRLGVQLAIGWPAEVDVLEAVETGVYKSMPYAEQILDAVERAVKEAHG